MAEPVVRGNPHLDEIIVIPKRQGVARWRDDWSWARRLRAARFDIAIDLHGGPRCGMAHLGQRSPDAHRLSNRRAHLDVHPCSRDGPKGCSRATRCEINGICSRRSGSSACDPSRDAVEMAADSDAEASVSRKLQNAGIRPDAPLVVVHVSAGNPFRRWPPESFVEAITELARRDPTRRFILTSGPSDADAARAIADRIRERLGPVGRSGVAR